MNEFLKNNLSILRRFFFYVVLLVAMKLYIENQHFPTYAYILLSLLFLIPELISEYKPQYLAYLYVNRVSVIYFILAMCVVLSAYFYKKHPPTKEFLQLGIGEMIKPMVEIILQGAVLGLITRMLLIHLFYQLIRARNVYFSKVLLMIIYFVLLLLLPLRHKYFLSPFFVGFGVGFLIHYLSRTPEKRNARYARLAQNLLAMVESIKKGNIYRLTSVEENAIKLYAKQKWSKLNKLLTSVTETEVLFFVKLSMLRKLHEYDKALFLLKEKEEEYPVWYDANKHFFYLHTALNQNEKAENNRNRKEVIDDLRNAININEYCLLSNASLALKLANEVDFNDIDHEVKERNAKLSSEALGYIWKAMTIYERRDNDPKIISLITGIYIPFTYSFLLDTYGYVLLKAGRFQFSKALLTQCLYQDPSFSPTYLHLAEWYIEYFKNTAHKNEHWEKAAKLNLSIAIYNEELDNKNGSISFISTKARQILDRL